VGTLTWRERTAQHQARGRNASQNPRQLSPAPNLPALRGTAPSSSLSEGKWGERGKHRLKKEDTAASVVVQHQALPDRAGISRCLESHPPGERQSCTVWVALEFRAAVCITWSVTRTENHRCLRSTISGPYKQRYQGSPSSPFGPQRAAPSDSLAAGRFSE